MATQEVLQQRLEEAETALHQLMIGKQTASITYEGRSRTFTQAQVGDLKEYIKFLEDKIGGKRTRSRKVYF